MSGGLRSSLRGQGGIVVGGAHDALSARLVEEAGFDAVWLSSLGVSTALRAVPDLNLVTMTEMLEVGRNIVGRVRIPVIADCENGYGDARNVFYMVQEFERAGVGAACFEDNEYPKRNSFYEMDRDLISIGEMEAKIDAAVSARQSGEFAIIARTEALIAGLGVPAAVERARAYEETGADAVVVHARSWALLEQFLAVWTGKVPLVVIPTMFAEIGTERLFAAGFKMVIYANQALRAALRAMAEALGAIRQGGGCAGLGERLASLKELEALVGADGLMLEVPRPRFAARRPRHGPAPDVAR
ncbi:MAG TPA: isocitrate lyase/PEP mutase family protein [Thermoanaerobaculia bacterium]|nr:isocitrate lyase/PEP mutase family protein [Thermoanaerobaculia bacterium]